MAGHTPGPWRAVEYPHTAEPDHTYWNIEGGPGYRGNEAGGFCLTGFISAADARLAAGAPELLNIAERLAEWRRRVDDPEDDLEYLNIGTGWADLVALAADARAAIAKATGQ